MKKLFLLFVSALICGAMVFVSSGNGGSPNPSNHDDAQLPGEHQVTGRNVPKPAAWQSFDLPPRYVCSLTILVKT